MANTSGKLSDVIQVVHIQNEHNTGDQQFVSFDDSKINVVQRRKELTAGVSRIMNGHDLGATGSTNAVNSGTVNVEQKKAKETAHYMLEITTNEERLPPGGNVKVRSGSIFTVTEQVEQMEIENGNGEAMQTNSAVGCSGVVSIEIAEKQDGTLVNLLRSFFLLMYYLGLSTYDPRRDRITMWSIVQKVLFYVVAIAGLMHALHDTKFNCLVFAADGGMTNFVDAGFCIVPVVAEIYLTCLFAFQHGRIKRMLSCMSELYEHGENDVNNKMRPFGKRVRQMIKLLAAASIIMCGLVTSSDVPILKWSPKAVILSQSTNFAKAIFVWNEKDIAYKSNLSTAIRDSYGTEVTGTTFVMALTAASMEFFSNLKIEIVFDLVIVAGWCFKECIRRQANRVRNIDFATYTDGNDAAELNSPTGDWARYKKLKAANKAINVVFDGILKIMHIQNTMVCAYFLMHLLQGEVGVIQLLCLIYNITKMSMAYYIAKESHGYNAVFQQWIRDWAVHSQDPTFHGRYPAILDEMKSEPLGLGSGEFIIGESFILKFIGMVGSLFVLQVDNAEEI